MVYIWSFEHKQWWAANSQGYVEQLENAGQYEPSEAGRITAKSIFMSSIIVTSTMAEKGPPTVHPYYE